MDDKLPSAPFANYSNATGRDISALLMPRPVVLIGACLLENTACFTTVAWITPISHSPAMLAFALRERSFTMDALRSVGAFSVCTLPANAQGIHLAEICGNTSGHRTNKGMLVPHHLEPSEIPHGSERSANSVTVPVANDALSWLSCCVQSITETGDHLLVVGTVTQAHTLCNRDKQGRVIATDTLLCTQHDIFAAGNCL